MLILIDGSGRSDGNGAYLAGLICSKYHVAKRINLRELNFKDCNSCNDCRKQKSICTIEDDLQQFYPDFMEADGIILISPGYYGLPSGDVKKLIDRWYCMKKPRKQSRFKEGAKMLFFLTQGSRHKTSYFALFWLGIIMRNHKCQFKGRLLTDCSFDDLEGVKRREINIISLLKKFTANMSI